MATKGMRDITHSIITPPATQAVEESHVRVFGERKPAYMKRADELSTGVYDGKATDQK